MRTRLLLLLIAAILAGATLAQSPVYKWVDKTGEVHYSSVPPSASLAPTSIVNTSADEQAPPATTVPAASTTQATDKALTSIKPGDSAACKSARETLSKYLSATYLYTLNKDGAKQKLSRDQQTRALAEARNNVTAKCSTSDFQP